MASNSYDETRTDWASCASPPRRAGVYEVRPTQTLGPVVKVEYSLEVLIAWIAFGNAGYQWRGLKHNPKRKSGPKHVLALYTENGEVAQCMPVKMEERDGILSNSGPITFPKMEGVESDRITHAMIAWKGGSLVTEISPALPIGTGIAVGFGPFELAGLPDD